MQPARRGGCAQRAERRWPRAPCTPQVSHYKQYPPGTEYVYSYFESRGGKFDEICFFGLQYFIKRYLAGPVVTADKIAEAKELLDNHMGPGHFNEEGWNHILTAHEGKLPISIKSVPEGTIGMPPAFRPSQT